MTLLRQSVLLRSNVFTFELRRTFYEAKHVKYFAKENACALNRTVQGFAFGFVGFIRLFQIRANIRRSGSTSLTILRTILSLSKDNANLLHTKKMFTHSSTGKPVVFCGGG